MPRKELTLEEIADRYFKYDLQEWPGHEIMAAAHGELHIACQGACDHHEGSLKVCRVIDVDNPYDWGWFVYCDTAIKDDTNNRFVVVDLQQYGKLLGNI